MRTMLPNISSAILLQLSTSCDACIDGLRSREETRRDRASCSTTPPRNQMQETTFLVQIVLKLLFPAFNDFGVYSDPAPCHAQSDHARASTFLVKVPAVQAVTYSDTASANSNTRTGIFSSICHCPADSEVPVNTQAENQLTASSTVAEILGWVETPSFSRGEHCHCASDWKPAQVELILRLPKSLLEYPRKQLDLPRKRARLNPERGRLPVDRGVDVHSEDKRGRLARSKDKGICALLGSCKLEAAYCIALCPNAPTLS
eukprot:3476380-Rhodomonas_salina.4